MSVAQAQSSRAAAPALAGKTKDELDEKIFGAAFNGHVIRRFLAFMRPYRKRLLWAVFAVVLFTATQLAIPLVIRAAIDHALGPGAMNESLLGTIALGF